MKKAISFLICTALFVSIFVSMPAAALADEADPTPAPEPSSTPAPTVTSRYALLSGIDATLGIWDKEFSYDVRSYTLTLDETQKTVTITPKKGTIHRR